MVDVGAAQAAKRPPVNTVSAAYRAASAASAAGATDAPLLQTFTTTQPAADAAGGVTIGTGGSDSIRVTPESAAADGARIPLPGGNTLYRGADPNVSTVVVPTADGAQIATVTMNSPGSAQAFRYRLALPGLSSLRAGTDGGVDIVRRGGTVIGHVAAPWARDSRGTSLPTAYQIEGGTLVQTVDTTRAVFPVVADPKIERLTFFGIPRGVKIWFSRHETEVFYRNRAFAVTAGVPLGIACAGLSAGTLTALCATAVSYVTVDFVNNVELAHRRNHCLWLELGLPKLADWGEGDGGFCVHPR